MSDDEQKAANDYEQQRLANIKANDDLLRSLGIAAGNSTSSLGIPVKKRASSPPAKKAPRPKKVKTEPSAIPARRSSARLLGIQADSETLKIKLDEEERELKEMKEAKRRATHGPYSLDNLPEPIPKADLSALTSTLASTSSSVAGLSSTGEAKSQAAGVAELRQKFSSMAIKKYAKVTSDRVFSMVIHPDPTKTLVFVGDKTGQLGIWDPLAEKDDKDDEEGEEGEDHEGKHWRIQAHGSSSVSCIKVSPSDHTKLFTSSYDCTIRQLSLSTQKSTEVFSIRDSDCLISSFDLTPDGQSLWASDKHGGLSHRDLREGGGGGRLRRWEVGEGIKMGAVSVNPVKPWLLLTAGNDRTVRIWDTRHLHALPLPTSSSPQPSSPSSSDDPLTYPTSSTSSETVLTYRESTKGRGLLRGLWKHGKSCSSAYWDPSGGRVLTTSYDDHLRVWNINQSAFKDDRPLTTDEFGAPDVTIAHDCQTGRWLSILRAQWSQNRNFYPHFTVGSMRRSLDVYAATGEPIAHLFDPEIITAVPAVTAAHPSIVNHVVGGNGSGKCYLWAPSEQEAEEV